MMDCLFRVVVKKDEVLSTWMVSCSPESNFYNHEFVAPMALTKYRAEVVDKYDNTIVQYVQRRYPTGIYCNVILWDGWGGP